MKRMVCSVEDNGLYDLFLKFHNMSIMKVVWHSSEFIVRRFAFSVLLCLCISHKGTTMNSLR